MIASLVKMEAGRAAREQFTRSINARHLYEGRIWSPCFTQRSAHLRDLQSLCGYGSMDVFYAGENNLAAQLADVKVEDCRDTNMARSRGRYSLLRQNSAVALEIHSGAPILKAPVLAFPIT